MELSHAAVADPESNMSEAHQTLESSWPKRLDRIDVQAQPFKALDEHDGEVLVEVQPHLKAGIGPIG